MNIKVNKPVQIDDGDITRIIIVRRILPVLGTNKCQYIIKVDEINRDNKTWRRFEDIVDMKRLKELLNTKKKITIEE